MSYCRWSSDDFRCDVYVYESAHGGYQTHVAANRADYDGSNLPEKVELAFPEGAEQKEKEQIAEKYLARHNAVLKLIDNCKRVDIGLSRDGESFNDPTPGACADRLDSLKQEGYIVPQYAIDALRAEQEEIDSGVSFKLEMESEE